MAPKNLKEKLSRPPPWLTTSCSASSAQLFSRILTVWSNPPSVTWRNETKRQLTSTVVKTGKAVSKHIPWFLMEFIALQAEYPELIIEEVVQKELKVGIFALFGVLGTYERDMCMGALDGPGRGIFKSLWEEWNKFGKFVEQ
jgi:nucleolar pre-ribosomal-associated protein 2